jgi:hypothetical protein
MKILQTPPLKKLSKSFIKKRKKIIRLSDIGGQLSLYFPVIVLSNHLRKWPCQA